METIQKTKIENGGEKLEEVQTYITQHRIPEIFQTLTQALLVERPENPYKYMEKQLLLMRSIKARNQNHVLFSRENLMSLFRYYDQVGRGYITNEQYREAMATVGATKYSLKPSGYATDKIPMDAFAEEALTSLRRF